MSKNVKNAAKNAKNAAIDLAKKIAEMQAEIAKLQQVESEVKESERIALEEKINGLPKYLGVTHEDGTLLNLQEIASIVNRMAKHGSLKVEGKTGDGTRKARVTLSYSDLREIVNSRLSETPIQWSVLAEKFGFSQPSAVVQRLESEKIGGIEGMPTVKDLKAWNKAIDAKIAENAKIDKLAKEHEEKKTAKQETATVAPSSETVTA